MGQYVCCSEQEWEPVADLGHAAGVDFDLGRCKNCGTYLMGMFHVSSTTYNVLSNMFFLRLTGNKGERYIMDDVARLWLIVAVFIEEEGK